uniref:Pol polyprotein n=1 Tax=Tanacetum cinerariifolium TaxID=118510 RepID=A0A6L2LUD4_TANCI|nr:Pol polyprotein [Tanacetum cinerariifolium]
MDQTILKSHVEKPKKFKGSDFHRWQQKMLFYLTSLHVTYVLKDSEPVDPYMVDGQNVPTEAQMMNDAKPVVKQVEELQIIVHEIEVEGMGINPNFLVGSIIEKLPQSWKNFKLYLKHLTDDMSFEQLVLKIRVKEDNMMNEKADANSIEPNANMVGEISSKSKSNHKSKGKNGGSRHKYSKDRKKDYTQQRTTTSRKFITVGSVENLGIKLRIVATRKNTEVEILEEIPTKQTMWSATKHICNSRRMFVSYQKVNESEPMFTGNETASKIEGKGKVILKLTSANDLVLSNVLHVPNITKNLISGPILSNKGFKLVFESDKFVITKGGVHVGKGYLDEGLFKLSVVTDDNDSNNNKAGTSTASVYMIDPYFLWHSRLGRVNFCSLQRMINFGMLPKCSKDKISKCEIFVESKFTSHSHKSIEKSNEILGLIHNDLCDFKATPLKGGKNYYITLLMIASKFYYVYLINTKDEALNMLKTYKAEVENQLDKKIKILRSDSGGEYKSNDLSEFCFTFGIVHHTTAPCTPQQNRVVECKNKTLKNMINSMSIALGDPQSLWGEACLAANTILNKIPHKKSDKSPYQLWKGKQPPYKRMKVWGCLAKVQIPLPKRTKHGPKTVDCVYLDPAKNSAAYGFLVYKSNVEDISNNTIIESVEAEFFENIFPYKDKEKKISNPRKRKLRPDGTIEKYKARLVAKGYPQKEDQDFFDTYSPVTRMTSIRTLIAIAAIHNLIIHQMDVKTVFLNGEFDEEIYMQQPNGFVVKGQEHKMDVINQTKKMLHSSFDMKDMGEADVILEFAALDKATEEAEWLRSFLEGIHLWPKPVTAVCIHCDSMAALTRAKNHI